MDNLAIGIDLGTTNCCISIYRNNKVQVLENTLGERTTPTVIFFTSKGGTVIGKHAQKMTQYVPENGIYEIKRIMGRKYDNLQLQESLKYLPYSVNPDESNLPLISLKQKNGIVTKTPQELYTAILKELKQYAEEKLDQEVTKAVITVPAYFNNLQREVTLSAAKDAGFKVLKLLNEPTAAALAYYFEKGGKEKRRCVVYDFGGGTFDIAVVEKEETKIQVICVYGDTQLGGKDLDKCILDYVCRKLKENFDYDVQTSDDKRRLRIKCEEAKKQLSAVEETVIVLNGLVPEQPKVKIEMKREQFEIVADDIFKKTIHILDKCIKSSKIPKESIQEVILCGGSTRIPKIQQLLSEYFDGKELSKFVNPDECVAEGAALQAAMLSTSQKQHISRMEMVDVVPFSLGFDSMGNEMQVVIKRNTVIPTYGTKIFSNVVHNQKSMHFKVYEGERSDVRKNRLLGTFTMSDLTPAAPGQLKIFATLKIDQNGILTATAEERFARNMKEVQIAYTRGDRTGTNVENSSKDAVDESDDKFRNFVRLKCYLIEYCTAVMYNLEEKKLTEKYKRAYDLCEAMEETVEKLEMHREDGVKTMIDKCKEHCGMLVKKYNFKYMPVAILYNN